MMAASPEEICNRALSDIGARVLISSIGENTPAGTQCELWYDILRKQLLQAAPWSFARKTVALTQLALLSDSPMPDGMYPWLVKYTYPADCLRVNYILPPPILPVADIAPDVSGGPQFTNGWLMPSRSWRFLPAYDTDPDEMDAPRKVLLSNLIDAYGVYVVDVEDTTLFDPSFEVALSAALSYKLVMPLTGNAGMKSGFQAIAQQELLTARVKNSNEAISSSDHTPDWIAVRGFGAPAWGVGGGFGLGQWYNGWDDVSWGS